MSPRVSSEELLTILKNFSSIEKIFNTYVFSSRKHSTIKNTYALNTQLNIHYLE